MYKNKENELNLKLEGYKKLSSQAEASEKALLKTEIAILEKEIAIEKGKIEIPKIHLANIKAWELKHGKVKTMAIVDGKDIKFIFFRIPSREELSAAESLATNESGDVDLYTKGEKTMGDCYLGGDMKLEDIMAHVEFFMPVVKKILYELVVEKKTLWIDC
ncbi:MAG: hypothetical protein QM500_08565 [Methylococcales bacterium]